MAVLFGMPTIQYSAASTRLYLIGGYLGLPQSSTQTASRWLQPFLQGSLGDRQTDRPRYSVGNNRRHLTYEVLQCGLIIIVAYLDS